MAESNFSEQIILLVTDKLILGAIIGVDGLWATRLLERYKTSQAIREEVAKERIKRMSIIWEEITTIRQEYTLLHINAVSAAVSKSNPEEIKEMYRQFRGKTDKIIIDIRNNRFWLGNRLWNLHQEYLNNFNLMISRAENLILNKNFNSETVEELKNLVKKEDQSHLNIEDIILML